MSDELIGKNLGNYRIEMILGKGGMSTVYMAHQPSMDRTVAIKVLPREFLHDDTFLIRFQQEIKMVSRLEHPHILPVYDAGEADGVPYIVMRYVSGGTLADQLMRGLPGTDMLLNVVEQIAQALDYANEFGVIHRDLKPSNILLDERGNAYLADFGVSRSVTFQEDLTGSRIIGTPPYIAPEAVRKDDMITGSSDLYALGVLTYEMLIGHPPYQADDPMKVLVAHVLEPIPSLRAENPKISPAVESVVQRCLAKDPDDRHETAVAYAQALIRAFETTQPGSGPILSSEKTQERAAVPRQPDPLPPSQGVVERVSAENTQPPTDQSRVMPARPVAEVAPAPPPASRAESKSRGGGGAISCLVPIAVVGAIIVGVIITAVFLTQGNPLSLLDVLTPLPTLDTGGTSSQSRTPIPNGEEGSGEAGATVETNTVVLPAPSGGDRLAFTSNRDGDFDIYIVDIDGSGLRNLTNNGFADFDPAWSPDGTKIIYAVNEEPAETSSRSDLWVMNADGSNPIQLTDLSGNDADPDWSPSGDWVVFTSDTEGTFDLYIMDASGGNICQLTSISTNELTPRWSPDGRQISYHARAGTNRATSDIWILEVDPTQNCDNVVSGDPVRVTDNNVRDEWADWSPDGRRLMYTTGAEVGDGHAIAVLNLTDGTVTRLTDGLQNDNAVRDDDPVWSPDGTRIAFDSDRDGGDFFDLYILDIQTGQITQLTFEQAADVVPAWQPR